MDEPHRADYFVKASEKYVIMVGMHGYELPIDLEVLKAMPRPLPA